MNTLTRLVGVALIALVGLSAAGCAGDPYQDVLEQRARWTVQLLSWAGDQQGGYRLSTRISGPTSSSIDRLTVAIDLLDDQGARIERVWHTFDLSDIPRGGPKDVSLRVPAAEMPASGIAIDPVSNPTDEERRQIAELRDLEEG